MGTECIQEFNITENLTGIVIIPGGTNCFSCELRGLDQAICNVTWQVSNGTHLVSVSSSPHAETAGDDLLIARPETYVQPGVSGQQTIVCSADNCHKFLEARLVSPGMRQTPIIIIYVFQEV